VGCGLIIFEFVEHEVIGNKVRQPIRGSTGVLIALVSLAPSAQPEYGLRWRRI
jgi:hypothetical protein